MTRTIGRWIAPVAFFAMACTAYAPYIEGNVVAPPDGLARSQTLEDIRAMNARGGVVDEEVDGDALVQVVDAESDANNLVIAATQEPDAGSSRWPMILGGLAVVGLSFATVLILRSHISRKMPTGVEPVRKKPKVDSEPVVRPQNDVRW